MCGSRDIDREVRDALDRSGVPYELIPCDPDLADTAEFCAHYGYPLENSANTIVVASKRAPKQFAACVVAADTRLDVNRRVKQLMGAGRLSFAKPDETAEVTGMLLGGVTVLALRGLPVYVDRHLMDLDYVILGGGSRSLKVKVVPAIFDALPGVEMISDLALPSV